MRRWIKVDLSEEKLESIRKMNSLNGNRSRIVKRNDFVYSSISTAFLIGFIGNIIVASGVLFFVSDNRIHVAILLDWLSKSTPIYQSSRSLDHMRSFRFWESAFMKFNLTKIKQAIMLICYRWSFPLFRRKSMIQMKNWDKKFENENCFVAKCNLSGFLSRWRRARVH